MFIAQHPIALVLVYILAALDSRHFGGRLGALCAHAAQVLLAVKRRVWLKHALGASVALARALHGLNRDVLFAAQSIDVLFFQSRFGKIRPVSYFPDWGFSV